MNSFTQFQSTPSRDLSDYKKMLATKDLSDIKKMLGPESLVEKYTNKISIGYTRKINVDNSFMSSTKNNNKTIIELDLTNDDMDTKEKSFKRSAQKRPTSQQAGNDENFNSLSAFENISKVNRRLSEFEKKMNEKLNKSHSVLDIM